MALKMFITFNLRPQALKLKEQKQKYISRPFELTITVISYNHSLILCLFELMPINFLVVAYMFSIHINDDIHIFISFKEILENFAALKWLFQALPTHPT